MITRRVRGAALVEYAFILVCVTGLAGAGMKAIHGKAKTTAISAGDALAGGSAGAAGGGSSASDRPSGGNGSGPSTTGGGGNTNKPRPQQQPKGPKKIEPNDPAELPADQT